MSEPSYDAWVEVANGDLVAGRPNTHGIVPDGLYVPEVEVAEWKAEAHRLRTIALDLARENGLLRDARQSEFDAGVKLAEKVERLREALWDIESIADVQVTQYVTARNHVLKIARAALGDA